MSSRPITALLSIPSIDPIWADPISSFFSFIQARESVRVNKLSTPYPWSSDPVLNTVKFTNIHRTHDRTTSFILEHLKPIADLETLILNAVFCRYVNLPSTIQTLGILNTQDNQRYLAEIKRCQPIRSVVYQVPVNCLGAYSKIEDFFFLDVFPKSKQMLQIVQDGGSIWHMTQRLSYEVVQSGWHTVFSQALLDLSVLRPALVDAESISYIGYGAKPALAFFKRALNLTVSDEATITLLCCHPQNSLNLTFADIEHAICEWRKYIEFTRGIRKIKRQYIYTQRTNS